jgi:hypothetical protein
MSSKGMNVWFYNAHSLYSKWNNVKKILIESGLDDRRKGDVVNLNLLKSYIISGNMILEQC